MKSVLWAVLMTGMGVTWADRQDKLTFSRESKGNNEASSPADPVALSWLAVITTFKIICVDDDAKKCRGIVQPLFACESSHWDVF